MRCHFPFADKADAEDDGVSHLREDGTSWWDSGPCGAPDPNGRDPFWGFVMGAALVLVGVAVVAVIVWWCGGGA